MLMSPDKTERIANPKARARRGEEGYILIAVIFLMVMVLIALSVAAPKVAADIQRDREIELMHRGKQYQRAIQLYYRKFAAYPPTMEALEKQNQIRFLRKRYKDPATGKDEWHLIHFGEAKTQTLGFFGQPIAGAGSAGGSVLAGTGPGAQSGLGSPIGGGITDPNANAGNAPNAASANAAANPSGAAPDPNAASNANGAAGAGNSNSPLGSTTGGSSFGSSSTSNNQTFGGGGIIGVESTSPKATILEYKKKKHFNEWEFVYDPLTERQTVGGNSVGQPIGGDGTTNPNGGFGNGINGGINGGIGQGNGQGNGGILGSPTQSPGGFGTPTPTPPTTPPSGNPQ